MSGLDVQVLAGPIRRRAIEATDAMPPVLQSAVGTLLGHLAGPLDGDADGRMSVERMLGRQRQSVQGQARRTGYHQPGAIWRLLSVALAIRCLDAGMTITETAYRLGWSSPQAFGRAFRDETGRTPSQRGDMAWEPFVDAALRPIGQAELFAASPGERVA